MKHLIFILASIICLASAALPCSMVRVPEPPLGAPDEKSYIFVGEVIGYTDLVRSRVKPGTFETEDKFYGEGRGLKIKPVAAINLPKASKDYYELYKFAVTTWCADRLIDAGYLRIGTRLRIAASESTLLPNPGPDDRIRLESKIFDRFSVADDGLASSASSEFDYKNDWKALSTKLLAAKEYEKRAAFDDFLYLETTKDLLRLKHAKSKKKRHRLLERLLYNPKVDYPALISPLLSRHRFSLLLQLGAVQEKQVKLTPAEMELLKKRRELEESGYFKP